MWCSGSYKHIYLRGHGFESPWSLFFNLILARREMHVGMRIVFVGGGMRKTRDSQEWNENGLCSEDGMGMAEHGIGQPTPYRLNR
jgi:hypothetical protein